MCKNNKFNKKRNKCEINFIYVNLDFLHFIKFVSFFYIMTRSAAVVFQKQILIIWMYRIGATPIGAVGKIIDFILY